MKFFISLTCSVIVALFASASLFAQGSQKSVVIGKMTTRPNALLILNPAGSNQGFLLPQLTTSARTSMTPSSPDEDGLLVFDITEKEFYHWKNNQWVKGAGGDVNQSLTYDPVTRKLTLSNGNTVDLTPLKEIPQQTGNNGKFLTTDGTNLSWGAFTLIDGSVTTAKLADNSVTSAKITDNSITSNDIANSAITSVKLANTSVTAGTYGNATNVSQITVDAQGRITSAVNVPITGSGAPTTQYYSIDPLDFKSTRLDNKKDHDNSIVFDDNTAYVTLNKKDEAGNLIAPVHLPDGATIQSVLLYYVDNDGPSITMNFTRKALGGTNDNITPTWNSSVNNSTILSATVNATAGKDVVDNSQYSYRVAITLRPNQDTNNSTDAKHRVYGLQIKYLK